jgi:hypothetical protein
MSLFPMSSGTSLVKTKSIDSLVQDALRTNAKDTKAVSNAVAKLLPDKVKAFANETKGLPRMPVAAAETQMPSTSGHEQRRIEELMQAMRHRFDDLLDEVDAEQDGPVIEAIRRATLDAVEQGRTAAPNVASSTSRDMLFATRTILRDRAAELRFRGLGGPAALLRFYFDLADDLDQSSALLLVTAGAALMQVDSGSGETLLDVSVQELRVRAEQVLRTLDRLSGLEEHTYQPDATYWPDHYNTLRDWLGRQFGGDQYRPFLVREELAAFMQRLVDVVGADNAAGFREMQAGVLAGCLFLDGFLLQLVAFTGHPVRPPIAPGDPDRHLQFTNALLAFRLGFTGTEGVLIGIATRPLALHSWARLRIPVLPPAGPIPVNLLIVLIPSLLTLRALVAQAVWTNQGNVGLLTALTFLLLMLDTVLDLVLRGNVFVV